MEAIMQKPIYNAPAKDQIIDTINDYTIEVCLSKESKKRAYQLRYESFLQTYPQIANNDQLLYDLSDELENSRIHLIWYENKPVATIKASILSEVYNWLPSESLKYFEEDIWNTLGKVNILESCRYAISPEFQGRKSLFAQMLCFRIHALNSLVHDCNHIITSVRPHHAPFYKRFLGLEILSEEEKNIPWLETTGVLLGAEREKSMETALKRGMPAYTEEDVQKYALLAKIPMQHQTMIIH